jgi:fucose permease
MKALKGFRATDISLMVLLFFHAICAIITGTLLPQIIKEFSIDYATAGSIETLRSYAILFILVITVKLLRVVSAKTLFVLSRFGIAVGFVMSALSGNYSFFLAGVILAGLGAGFVESLIAQTITNLHQAENNTEKFFNAIQGVFSIAVILIPLLYGYAMEHGVTWRQIFLYTSIMPVVVAFILLFSDLPAVEAEEGGYSEALKAVFSKAAGRLLSIGIFVSAGIENMFYVWSATYISLYLHDNQQYAATGLAIFGLFMCLARFTTALLNGKKIAYYMMYIAQICGFTSAILLFTMEGIEIF